MSKKRIDGEHPSARTTLRAAWGISQLPVQPTQHIALPHANCLVSLRGQNDRFRYIAARIKDIPAHVYARIEAAYAAECERQGRKLAHELAIARKIAPSALSPEDLVDDADATPRVPPFIRDEGEER